MKRNIYITTEVILNPVALFSILLLQKNVFGKIFISEESLKMKIYVGSDAFNWIATSTDIPPLFDKYIASLPSFFHEWNSLLSIQLFQYALKENIIQVIPTNTNKVDVSTNQKIPAFLNNYNLDYSGRDYGMNWGIVYGSGNFYKEFELADTNDWDISIGLGNIKLDSNFYSQLQFRSNFVYRKNISVDQFESLVDIISIIQEPEKFKDFINDFKLMTGDIKNKHETLWLFSHLDTVKNQAQETEMIFKVFTVPLK